MRLCMFHPHEIPMERGWVGRLDGDRVLHLAAQTLQSFFLGGGGAREHAEYPLAEVTVLAPVQYPPTVRLFAANGSFSFANASAVVGTGAAVEGSNLVANARIAAVIGAGGTVGGYTALLEWCDPSEVVVAKQCDFGLVLGPTVVTVDAIDPETVACRLVADDRAIETSPPPFAWQEALALAATRTQLRPGDVIAGPPVATLDAVSSGAEFDVGGVGTLTCPLR